MIKYRLSGVLRTGGRSAAARGVCKAVETVIYGRPLPGTRTSPDLHEIAFNGLVGGLAVSVKAAARSVPRASRATCPRTDSVIDLTTRDSLAVGAPWCRPSVAGP